MVLDKATTISSLAFLRCLHASSGYISALIEDLKASRAYGAPGACSAQISQTLDQQVEELFVPYLAETPISSRRRRAWRCYSSLLLQIHSFLSPRRAEEGPNRLPWQHLAQQGTQLPLSAEDASCAATQNSSTSLPPRRQKTPSSCQHPDNSTEQTERLSYLRKTASQRRLRQTYDLIVGREPEADAGVRLTWQEKPKDVATTC